MPRSLGREIANPTQYTWLNVLTRAQEEAEGMYVYDHRRGFVMRQAKKWLTCSRDFFVVCRFAGMDPDRAIDLRYLMIAKYGREIYGGNK